jgi:hypothetical protein
MPKPGATLQEPPKKQGKKKPSPPAVDLPVVYPEEDVQMFACREGKKPLYAEDAKKALGWEEENEKGQFGDKYLFINPFNKKKVRCTYNVNNRPFDIPTALKYLQTIMKRRWKFNLETIIIGRFGSVLSGQHRLIALVLAEYARMCEDIPEGGDESWKTTSRASGATSRSTSKRLSESAQAKTRNTSRRSTTCVRGRSATCSILASTCSRTSLTNPRTVKVVAIFSTSPSRRCGSAPERTTAPLISTAPTPR